MDFPFKIKIISLVSSAIFLFGCRPSNTSVDSGVPYDSGIRTQTISVYQAPIDSIIPVSKVVGKQNKWLCEFYVNRIRFLYNNRKDSIILRYDMEREIRNNEILSPSGVNFENYKFSFERDPVGLNNYDERGDPNADSTWIKIVKDNTSYEGYLVKRKELGFVPR